MDIASHRVLATDLDGTFIPLSDDPQQAADLATLGSELREKGHALVFVTGRHLASVRQAIEQHQLPTPDWVICDVGTSIFHRQPDGALAPLQAYQAALGERIASLPIASLRDELASTAGLTPQEDEKQGAFKLSYYVDAQQLVEVTAQVRERLDSLEAPYSIISSVDPFNGDGLIDLLPSEVSKAFALRWWIKHNELEEADVVFAGDSGNDLAALTAGYKAIIVANADRCVAREAYEAHRQAGWQNRLFLASGQATSGVLEGCRWFGLLDREERSDEPLGATLLSANETNFRVWAPHHWNVAVEVNIKDETRRHQLERDGDGYYAGVVSGAGHGAHYKYVLDDGATYPDPRSRRQPEGVHGPSEVVDPNRFAWTDAEWRGVAKRDLVIYELHIGAFTAEGTFRAAIDRLPELVELGVTAVELMPVVQTPGARNWGYDGVNLYAVRQTYGEPDDLKAYVDACHACGLAVLLDVVYNHLGPEGNYLGRFGPYFSSRHHTPWGDAVNYDDRRSREVRRFIVENALFWLDEYHFDGLRLDAVHFMFDDSEVSILSEIRAAVDKLGERTGRTLYLIGETNVHDASLLTPVAEARPVFDAIWCDCLMHSLYAQAAPGLQVCHRSYTDPQDLLNALRHGFVYHGPKYQRMAAEHYPDESLAADGRPVLESFITGLQTHDSVGNHPLGHRIHQLSSKAFQRAAAALTLLHPSIPMIFMGEEAAVEAPFPFFCDFEDRRLRRAVNRGRAKEHPQHDWRGALPPSSEKAYLATKCDDPAKHDPEMKAWYAELLALRKRGLAEGWLAADRLTVTVDGAADEQQQGQRYTLRYARREGGEVKIAAELATGEVSIEGADT